MKVLVLAVMLVAPATAWTQTPALDGTWTGTWRTSSGHSGSLVFRLTQAGEAVSGTYDAGDRRARCGACGCVEL